MENLRDLLESGLNEENRISIEEWISHEFWENYLV